MKDLEKELLRKINTRLEGLKTLGDDESYYMQQNHSSDSGINMQQAYKVMKEHLEYVNEHWTVNSNVPIYSNRKVIGKFIVFVKRAIRKCLRWYIQPVTNQQTEFNANNVNALNQINLILDNIEKLHLNLLNDNLDKIIQVVKSENEDLILNLEEIKEYTDLLEANVTKYIDESIQTANAEIAASLEEFDNEISGFKHKFVIFDESKKRFDNKFEHISENKKIYEQKFESIDEINKRHEDRFAKVDEDKRRHEQKFESIDEINIRHEQYFGELSGVNVKHERLFEELSDTNVKFSTYFQQLNELNAVFNQKFESMQSEIDMLKNEKNRMQQKLDISEENLKYFYSQIRMVRQNANMQNSLINTNTVDLAIEDLNPKNCLDGNYSEFDYFLFENTFRGTRENIKKSQEKYVRFFEGKDNVLDIGCGRGEFLELMSENNISVKGIDLNADFVNFNVLKGYNVILKDALEYLESIEDNSLGGIFMAQVLEHLTGEYIYKLLEISYKKLKPGCYFVAETQNPMTLAIYCGAFYIDLSHIKPVHPLTMKYLLGYYCFKDIDVILSSKCYDDIPELDIQSANTSEFNDAMKKVSNLLFGYQDYAVIGKK